MYEIIIRYRRRVHRNRIIKFFRTHGSFIHLANLYADSAERYEEQGDDEDQEGGEHDGSLATHLFVHQLRAFVASVERDARRIADHLQVPNDELQQHPDPVQKPIKNSITQWFLLLFTNICINTCTVVKCRDALLTLFIEIKHLSALQLDLLNKMTRVVHPFLIIYQKSDVGILLIDILSIIHRGFLLKLELEQCYGVGKLAYALHLSINILLFQSLKMTILYNHLIVELLGY